MNILHYTFVASNNIMFTYHELVLYIICMLNACMAICFNRGFNTYIQCFIYSKKFSSLNEN